MKKRKSIFRFLIVIMMLSLLLPVSAVNAEVDLMGKWPPKDPSPDSSLTIHKYAQEKGDKQKEGTGNAGEEAVGEPLKGVTFKLIQTHKFDPNTDKWTEVGRYGGETYERTTNADGQIIINNIPLGRYSVQEISGPPNVNINDKKYYVDIPMTNKEGTEHNYHVHIYPKNEIIRGAVELTKFNGEKKDRRGNYETLQGAQFKLYKEDGTPVNDQIYESDSSGKIQVDGLEYGKYYFEEVGVPEGYLKQSGKFEFSITKNGKFGTGKWDKNEGKIEKVEVTNYYKPTAEKSIKDGKKEVTELAINRGEEFTFNIKVNLPSDIQSYKNFTITDNLHDDFTYVNRSWSVSGANNSDFNFSQNGQTLTWSVKNFKNLKGKSVTISFKAKINQDAPGNVAIPNKGDIDYTNNSGTNGNDNTNKVNVIPTVGSVKVIKTDDSKRNKKKLSGAKFDLKKGNKVITSGVTDKNGELYFPEVDYGKYELVETKAPNGYRLLTKPIDVTVNAENHDVTLEVENTMNGWELPKTGGIGTTLFTFIGLTFMGAALLMFFRRRRGDAS